jgi:pyruvate dehydrogenase E2 component (dihydrolipoamide acetyltransferase)
MVYEFRLPDIGEGVAEGEVVRWFVQEGGSVQEDAPLVSVLTDKANVEIPSPKTGKVLKLHARVGEKVRVGGLLVTIDAGGPGPGPAASPPSGTPARPTEGGTAGPAMDKAPPAQPLPPASASPPTPSVAPLASPYVRRAAVEKGIDLALVLGTGTGGRVTEADLAAFTTSTGQKGPGVAAAMPARALSAAPTPKAPAAAPAEEVAERIPILGLRRVIAEHMSEATHRAAHFTYVEEVDASELVRLRDRMAKHVEKQGIRLTFLPFIVKGVVTGLRAHPRLNATMDDARGELVVRSAYHIGIATATPDGLLVPVIRNAETKSISQLAREIQELSERGRAGKLERHELSGSTFTITSLGALGGVFATPILNYPEVAILGVHKIRRRPVYLADGTIAPADLMNLSISLDHRVIDGYAGAQFLATVRSYLEDPHQLFAELV